MRHLRSYLLATLLLLLAAGQSAWAQSSFTVTADGSTFSITRTSNTSTDETVNYRTVSLSAIAGKHFTGKSGTLSFDSTHNTRTVEVTETAIGSIPSPYCYQEDLNRSYRLEITNDGGTQLAYGDRTILFDSSYQVVESDFEEKSIMVFTGEKKITEDGYVYNGYNSVPIDEYFSSAAPQDYLNSSRANLYLTVSLQAKELDDGYQHIQILVNETSNCDTDNSDDNPGTISYSYYLGCFSHDERGENTTYASYSFPYTAQGDDCGIVTGAWYNSLGNSIGDLRNQRIRENCRADDGRLIIPTDLSTLGLRFDGGGKKEDDWYVKNVYAKIQASDVKAPSYAHFYSVTEGPYYYGSEVTISIAFSEIVRVSGTPKLNTNWGIFDYIAGNGTNVLSFHGTITTTINTTLALSSITGTVQDMFGHAFDGFGGDIVLTSYSAQGYSINIFTELDPNTYAIANKTDLKHLATFVNTDHNCEGLTFRQTADITGVGSFTPIGNKILNHMDRQFDGTYDGDGHTISGLSVDKNGDYAGLFSAIGEHAVIENLRVSGSTICSWGVAGGIVGKNNGGTVVNCRVENDVYLTCYTSSEAQYQNIGGIVGKNDGFVKGCYSAASFTSPKFGGFSRTGGIVGGNSRLVQDCLSEGISFSGNDKYGAIVGYHNSQTGRLYNNYSTRDMISLGETNENEEVDGARRARTVTFCNGVKLKRAETVYNVSGLTAIGSGTYALRSGSSTYSGATQTLILDYTGDVPAGSSVVYIVTKTSDGSDITADVLSGTTLTMPDYDITISAVVVDNTMSITGSLSNGFYWATFYHSSARYTLPDGATAYTMDNNHHLYRLGDDGKTIPSGVAVVVIADSEAIILTKSDDETTITDHAPNGGNILYGSDSAVTLNAQHKVPVPGSDPKVYGIPYVLSVDEGGVLGFRAYTGDAIPAEKAYYVQ